MRPIRVFVLSESRLLRETFVHAFKKQSDLVVMGDCSRSVEANRLMAQSPCDVLLVDSSSSQWNSRAAEGFRSAFPYMKIILFNTDRGQLPHSKFEEERVAAYLSKESSADDVIVTVRSVAQREAFHPLV